MSTLSWVFFGYLDAKEKLEKLHTLFMIITKKNIAILNTKLASWKFSEIK